MVELRLRSILTARQWRLAAAAERAQEICASLNCSPLLARVIAARAERRPIRLEGLLRADFTALNPPWALTGMERAVERLAAALERNERIFIHGDFDVDGLAGAALLYLGLRRLGHREIKVEVEDRERGHGLNPQVVARLIREGFQVLITADCGVSDPEHIRRLEEHGIDVIVTDHHQPLPELPPATALIDPRLPGCAYENRSLAGVGVAFQLLRGLYERLGRPEEEAAEFLDLVMLGTVADLVPLIDPESGSPENKTLVALGLEQLARGGGRLGLRVLLKKLSLKPEGLSAGEVSYIMVPKLNAANRVGDPRVAFLLLTTEDRARAEYLAEILIDYNRDRQIAQDDLLFQAEEQIRAGAVDPQREKIIILEGDYWNPGIIGLVASDLVERYYRPTILISRGGRESRGSGRSIPEFDLIASLQHHQHLLKRYGGHQMAAGFSIATEKIPQLKRELHAYAAERLAELDGPRSRIDALLRPEEIELKAHEDLQRLAPFGMGNPEPRFLLPNVVLRELEVVGSEGKHLKCRAAVGDQEFECIGFDLGKYLRRLWGLEGCEVGLVFKLGRNEWLGRVRVQLELEDIVEIEAEVETDSEAPVTEAPTS